MSGKKSSSTHIFPCVEEKASRGNIQPVSPMAKKVSANEVSQIIKGAACRSAAVFANFCVKWVFSCAPRYIKMFAIIINHLPGRSVVDTAC